MKRAIRAGIFNGLALLLLLFTSLLFSSDPGTYLVGAICILSAVLLSIFGLRLAPGLFGWFVLALAVLAFVLLAIDAVARFDLVVGDTAHCEGRLA